MKKYITILICKYFCGLWLQEIHRSRSLPMDIQGNKQFPQISKLRNIAATKFQPSSLCKYYKQYQCFQFSAFFLVTRATAQYSRGNPFPVGNDTVYFSVVDAEGNACSFINSLYKGFGAGLVPDGCGFTLQVKKYFLTLGICAWWNYCFGIIFSVWCVANSYRDWLEIVPNSSVAISNSCKNSKTLFKNESYLATQQTSQI